MSAEAIARLREKRDRCDKFRAASIDVDADDLRALLDAHAALEAAHVEALDALEAVGVLRNSGYADGPERTCWCPADVFPVCRNTQRCLQAHSVLAKAGRR